MKYRLGLDMGATSIGWSVFDVESQTLINAGVRIFDDGRDNKSKASLCVKRRTARSARRLTNRKHIQMQNLLKVLTDCGLFPSDTSSRQELKKLNPYQLRKQALDKQLQPYEIGRCFLQLAERKGFRSNRKDNREEGGKLKQGYTELKEKIKEENARTYGEFLYNQNLKNQTIRLKNTFDSAGKFLGGLFPFREIYQEEFKTIWEKQKSYYPTILTETNQQKIQDALFFQRPLKEAEEGECIFEVGEKRIAKAHPLFQEFRIWQTILNLEFSPSNSAKYLPLALQYNNELVELLCNPQNIAVTAQGVISYKNIKAALKLDKNGIFNYERSDNVTPGLEKGLLVNTTQNAINKSRYLSAFWNTMSDSQKEQLINVITRPHSYITFSNHKISIEDEDQIISKYLQQTFHLSQEAAEELLYDIDLEDGFGSLSEKAIRKILPFIKQGMRYPDACQEAGYHHSDKEYTHLTQLPYYGKLLGQSCLGKKLNPQNDEEKYGKINNATVHVALNQVRHLVNEIMQDYGQPYDIAVEYARELGASMEERKKLSDTRDKNELENQKILKELNEKIGKRDYTKRDILKYKIWQRLPFYNKNKLVRECPFSGDPISLADLMNGQKFQIEHLLPFSRSLDDSLNNKVIATVDANRYKKERTPFEAFGESKDGYDWNAILHRAKQLPAEQQWRFAPDAMKKFEEQSGPIARSLNDTSYMTRILQDYLQPIVREDGKKRVQAVAGRLTSMVRKAWNLDDYKNKEDEEQYRALHNHHAIDAFVVSAIERGQIAQVAQQLKEVKPEAARQFHDELIKLRDKTVSKEEKDKIKKTIHDFISDNEQKIIRHYFPIPETIRIHEIKKRIADIHISHKPSLKDITDTHSTIGQLHEESAYGLHDFVDDTSLKADFTIRKDHHKEHTEKEIVDYIPMFYHKADKEAYYNAFKQWFMLDKKASTMDAKTKEEKAAKALIAKQEQAAIDDLRSAARQAFKWYVGGNNFCAEVYQINPQNKINGCITKDQGDWNTEIVSNYNATIRHGRGENIAYWHYKYPNAKRIMTLRRNDMVLGTFTREQASQSTFPKGLTEYVQNIFNQDTGLDQVDVLFRIKKISSDGRIYLTPHNIAKENADTKSWGASAGALKTYNARKVFVTSMGKIRHAK